MSLFARLSARRRARHAASVQRPGGVAAPPATAPSPAPVTSAVVSTTSVHRHGTCPVKHRSAAAAERCRNR
jgi:hypothetical protein